MVANISPGGVRSLRMNTDNATEHTRASGGAAILLTTVVCMACLAPQALAHNPLEGPLQQRLAGSLSAALLLGYWVMYVAGSRISVPSRRRAAGFHSVMLICVITILGPLDNLAKTSTAAHMTQHMLLMVVIAPLWVLCRPLPQLAAGGLRVLLPLWRPALRLTQRPMLAAILHGAAIWIWHLPYFYMLAVDNPWWHTFEHLCFLLTAGFFWWAVLRCNSRNLPDAMLALLLTLVHTGFLGAILTFSGQPLYGESRDLADQQMAGLIMWVPGAMPYLAAFGWLTARWYSRILA